MAVADSNSNFMRLSYPLPNFGSEHGSSYMPVHTPQAFQKYFKQEQAKIKRTISLKVIAKFRFSEIFSILDSLLKPLIKKSLAM